MPRRSISEMQTGSLQEEQIERVVGVNPGMVDQDDLRSSARGLRTRAVAKKSYSLNEESVITTSIGCGGLERQPSPAYSE